MSTLRKRRTVRTVACISAFSFAMSKFFSHVAHAQGLSSFAPARLSIGAYYVVPYAYVGSAFGLAKMSAESDIEPSFFYTTPVWVLSGTQERHTGVAAVFGASNFHLNQQQVLRPGQTSEDSVDLGTSIRGSYAYIIPTFVFYQPAGRSHVAVSLGLWGFGQGSAEGSAYFSATGTIKLDAAGNPLNATKSDIHVYDASSSGGLVMLLEIIYDNWSWALGFSGPELRSGPNSVVISDIRLGASFSWKLRS